MPLAANSEFDSTTLLDRVFCTPPSKYFPSLFSCKMEVVVDSSDFGRDGADNMDLKLASIKIRLKVS